MEQKQQHTPIGTRRSWRRFRAVIAIEGWFRGSYGQIETLFRILLQPSAVRGHS
jgi:hypothetical protein